MDRANGSSAAGQSKHLQQVQPQATTSNASDNESGRSEHDLAQPQPTPPRQTRPSLQRKESHHQQQAQQRSQKHQDKNASNNGASHLRQKTQKHVVGGGMSTTRLHARVPSSKALHKASSTKIQQQQQQQQQLQQLQHLQEIKELQHFQQLQQQQLSYHRSRASGASSSPSHPADSGSQQQRPQLHRRSTSGNESKLMRGGNSLSATSLVRRNVSSSSLKRNKSHADVSKRTGNARPTGHLKRAATTDRHKGLPSPNKKQPGVHFEIGSPDAQEDEWVDAGSSNVSGSRKNSLQYRDDSQRDEVVAQPNDDIEEEDDDNDDNDDEEDEQIVLQLPPKPKEHRLPIRSATGGSSQPPPLRPTEQKQETEAPRPSSSASNSAGLVRNSSTSRLLLPRTPPGAAPPMMSTETVSATHNVQSSPDSSPTRVARLPSGSGDREVMTSRFITAGSHESASNAAGGGSYYTTSSLRPGTARNDRDTPKSTNGTSVPSNTATPLRVRRNRSIGGDTAHLTDDDDSGIAASADGRSPATAGGSHPRRTRPAHAPPAEFSRTQQKLNLERASSSIDRSSRQHQGPAAGPLLGAGESGMHDPRISKLMERTGMEYYVVRRYQNPVTHSLARLSTRVEAEKHVRTPTNSSTRSSPGMAVNASGQQTPGRSSGGGAGLSQSFRERDMRRDALQSATAAAGNGTMPPLTRSRTFAANGSNGSSAGGPGSAFQPQQQRLSGSSLVDGYDEDSTAALLRNLWDKNLYLGTSQD